MLGKNMADKFTKKFNRKAVCVKYEKDFCRDGILPSFGTELAHLH